MLWSAPCFTSSLLLAKIVFILKIDALSLLECGTKSVQHEVTYDQKAKT